MLTALVVFVFVFSCYSFLVTVSNLIYFKVMSKIDSEDHSELVSIVIPARNEEGGLGNLLDSLIAQSYENIEIIVVDDMSEDGTSKVIKEFEAKDPRIKGYSTEGCEMTKTGKTAALVEGIKHAKGKYLMATDADTVHHVDSVKNSVGRLESNKLDIFSGYTKIECKGFMASECISPMFFIAALIPITLTNKSIKGSFAIGQCVFMRKEAYDRTGGYGAVDGVILDDVGIARLFIKNGFRYAFLNLTDDVRCLMYGDFRSALKGIDRSFSNVVSDSVISNTLFCLMILLAVLAFFSAPIALFIMLITRSLNLIWLFLASIPYAVSWFTLSTVLKRGRNHSLLYMMPYLMLLIIFIRGTIRRIRKEGTEWKGRMYN